MEILRHKYMKAWISYDGVQRVETYPYPEAALREAIFNAVAHKQYISGIPIQISVYKDKIYIYNNGKLHEMWTLEKLFSKHPSQPYNPLIATTFFVAGYIESWGRGIDKICTACENAGLQKPTYEIDATGIMLQIKANVDWDGNEIKYDENGEKVAIAEKKVVIDNENVVIDIEKIRKVLIETNMNSHTKEKIIVLFTSFGYDKDFGRKEISELFEITNNSAGNLINKMNKCNLLESHRGNGKGRYKFRKL